MRIRLCCFKKADFLLKIFSSCILSWKKNKAEVIRKTGRFDYIDSAIIISSICKVVLNHMTKLFAYTADDDRWTCVVETSRFASLALFSFFNYFHPIVTASIRFHILD